MAKLKSGKRLWFGVAVIVLVALLTVCNISSFKSDVTLNIDNYVSSGVYTAAV